MKEVMLAYDHELIDLQTEDTYLIDQLTIENTHLRRLLKIEDGIDFIEIGQRLKSIEEKINVVNTSKEDWKMPEEIRKTLEARHKVKETERLVNLQMRKLAEEEILREAEKHSKKSRQAENQVDLSKTTKNLSFLATSIQESEEASEENQKDDNTLKSEEKVEESRHY